MLHDEEDRLMAGVLLEAVAAGSGLIAAARSVIDAIAPFLEQEGTYLQRRFRHVVSEPSVRAALQEEAQGTIDHLAAEVGALRHREPGDLDVTLALTLLVNALLVAVQDWARSGFQRDVTEILDQCLDTLEHGISL